MGKTNALSKEHWTTHFLFTFLLIMNSKNPEKTLRERIWATVHKFPGCSLQRIAELLGEVGNISIGPALSTMKRQGIVYFTREGMQTNLRMWFTPYNHFPSLDELPLVVDPNCKKVLPSMTDKILLPNLHTPSPQLIGLHTNGEPKRIDTLIGDLTMNEAEELYLRLDGYFGIKANSLVN